MKQEILDKLSNIHEAKTIIEINDLLGYKTAEELKELQETINELVNEYLVFRTKKDKYLLLKNCPNLKIGTFSANKKGFGFVILDKEDDLYIGKDDMSGAIHDDVVLAEVIKKGIKKEGRILKILKRNLNTLVGEVIENNQELTVRLDDEKLNINLVLEKDSLKNCVVGHKVVISLLKQTGKNKYLGKVTKIIGHKDDPGIDILSIAYKYNIETEFSKEVEEELKNIDVEVAQADLINRRDLTKEMIFTIDGEHTKDIDDAISLTTKDNCYILGVHIADVSHYVKENTALGDSAMMRGTSNYLSDTVIPMLPHQISNGICSLNEGVIRLTMSCVMKIDKTGKLIDYEIFPSYIKSRKKMNYPKVNDILMRNIVDKEYEPFKDTLLKMNELAHILRKEKINRGYIDFEIDEAQVIEDDEGKAIDIVRRVREDGEKLIEDFMIEANETVASHIYNMGLPFIYRVHGEPNSDKITDFLNLVKILGYKLHTRVVDMSPKTMQKILNELKDKPEFGILSTLLLRSMKKAIYSKDNIGHFGLALKNYTHFTSPIRRFPDLTVHRLLKKYLLDKDFSMTTINYLENSLVTIAEHSSEKEQNAQNAERDVLDMKMAEYMESHVGEEYEGIISTVTNFGMFVQLPNLVEGLVHISSLKHDFYNYIPESLALVGKQSKKVYRIGDKVKVKCVSSNKQTAMIDFEVVQGDVSDENKK